MLINNVEMINNYYNSIREKSWPVIATIIILVLNVFHTDSKCADLI